MFCSSTQNAECPSVELSSIRWISTRMVFSLARSLRSNAPTRSVNSGSDSSAKNSLSHHADDSATALRVWLTYMALYCSPWPLKPTAW